MLASRRLVAAVVVLALVALGALPAVTGARGRRHAPRPRERSAPADAPPHADASRAVHGRPEPHGFRYTQLDIGQGDAALLESGDGTSAFVDFGPSDEAPALLAALAKTGGKLAWALVSHGHADHHGGLEAALGLGHPERVFVPRAPEEGVEWARTLAVVRSRGTRVVELAKGDRIDLGSEVSIEVLAPTDPPIVRSRSDVNANGLVVRADHVLASYTHRFLFTGDAELPTEARLLANPETLHADVLKVAHHGSGFSSSLRFLEAVAPRFAVLSAGTGNDYGHPHGAALERLLGVGARIFRTDLHGSIAFTSTAAGVAVDVEREVAPGLENVAPSGGEERLPKRHRPRHRHAP